MKIKINSDLKNKLFEIRELTGLQEKTLVNLAIYHGILGIKKNGFKLPETKKTHTEKKDVIEIKLGTITERELDDYLNQDLFRNKITRTRLIEVFIEAEIELIERKYLEDDENTCKFDNVRMSINLPVEIKRQIKKKSEETGVTQNQLYNYFLLVGYWETERNIPAAMVRGDRELLEYINNLGLPQVKALSLVQYVLKNRWRINKNTKVLQEDGDIVSSFFMEKG